MSAVRTGISRSGVATTSSCVPPTTTPPAAKVPHSSSPSWIHNIYALRSGGLLAFALVFGAFAANTLRGAMDAVPKAQVETAESFGMTRGQAFRRVLLPQMWVYALSGPLQSVDDPHQGNAAALSARDPGHRLLGARTRRREDLRLYLPARRLAGLVPPGGARSSYLILTWVSQIGFERLMSRLNTGQDTAGGDRLRTEAA